MTRSRIALFPGSFDPITVGHESVIRRALPMFDKIIVGVGVNSEKSAMLPSEKRVELIKKVFADEPKVEVVTYSGLTVDFCKANNNEIDVETFVGKVLFYLWNDVFKVYGIPASIGSNKEWAYTKFYKTDGTVDDQKVIDLMIKLKITAEGEEGNKSDEETSD